MPLPKLLHVLSGTLVALATATHAEKPINIAIYRGDAGCKGCSEMVAKSLDESGMRLKYNYIGEHEKLHVTDENLKSFDIYIQPGGGQDIPAAYDSLGDNGARAIRNFVKNGKGFIGLCMGAYLADKNWIGLINESLDSEVGRPHSGISDEGDYTINIDWFGIKAPFYYQDGPYFPLPDKKLILGLLPIMLMVILPWRVIGSVKGMFCSVAPTRKLMIHGWMHYQHRILKYPQPAVK